ncbi:MAG: DUF2510 domain-containing protein [Coriobacteriia bacterium]
MVGFATPTDSWSVPQGRARSTPTSSGEDRAIEVPGFGEALAGPTVQVPPGWLPDPTAQHTMRYWDGAAWTAHVHDAV